MPSFFEKWQPTLDSRRTIVPPRPLSKMSLWSFLRNCIGKDLTKIPMPVCMVCVGVEKGGTLYVGGWGLCVCLPYSLLSTFDLFFSSSYVYLYTSSLSSSPSLYSPFLPLLPPSPPSLSSLPLLPPSPPSLFSLPLLSLFSLPLSLLPPFTTPKVNFNEPLPMLQRMVEDFIYSDILAKAASCDTTLEELTYVAAFATSCYAANRVNKPFNPMLGETYECDRRAELGWRCFMEQVRGV